MLGAIIGDIAGSRFEFHNTFDYHFQIFSPESEFTDDSICSLAVADALLSGKSYQESYLYWCRQFPYPMGGYGGGFNYWLHSENPQPYGSYGNGSAMRVSAVGWYCKTLEEVKKQAKLSAEPTHNHPEGIKGAQAVAHAIFYLRNGGTLEGVKVIANSYYPHFEDMHFKQGWFSETCQETVPLCFQLLLKSHNFEDAIRKAVSWGGDSDTIGAIVGGMAEAVWPIPADMQRQALACLTPELRTLYLKFKAAIEK